MQLHGLILIYRSRRDGRLSWPGWLTIANTLPTHKVVSCQPPGKVGQLKTNVLTTEPRRQPWLTEISFRFWYRKKAIFNFPGEKRICTLSLFRISTRIWAVKSRNMNAAVNIRISRIKQPRAAITTCWCVLVPKSHSARCRVILLIWSNLTTVYKCTYYFWSHSCELLLCWWFRLLRPLLNHWLTTVLGENGPLPHAVDTRTRNRTTQTDRYFVGWSRPNVHCAAKCRSY